MNLNRILKVLRKKKKSSVDPIYEAIKNSGLFDSGFYLSSYSDVEQAGLDPLYHFITHGEKEGRDPSAVFSVSGYLRANPDVAEAGFNALHHYVLHGRREGRDTGSPLGQSVFDYVVTEPTVQPPPEHSPEVQGVEAQTREAPSSLSGERKALHKLLNAAAVFDTDYYLRSYPDVAASGLDPLGHYISSGAKEGRKPNSIFDADWYLSRYEGIGTTRLSAMVHYVRAGAENGFDPGPGFSEIGYIKQNGLNRKEVGTSLGHYLSKGRQSEARIVKAAQVPSDLVEAKGEAWAKAFQARLQLRMGRLKGQDLSALDLRSRPAFSLATIVCGADAGILFDLATSVERQAFQHFEWLLLVSPKSQPVVRRAAEAIAERDARFRLLTVADELAPVEALRVLLGEARGAYFIRLDADGFLYDDSLAAFVDILRADSRPAVIFSDEQNLHSDDEPFELVARRYHALGLGGAKNQPRFQAVHREMALQADAYSDAEVGAFSELDLTFRLLEKGARAVHVPEVLCGFRERRAEAKPEKADTTPYPESKASYRHTIQQMLARRQLDQLFDLGSRTSRTAAPDCLVRRDQNLPATLVDLVVPFEAEELGSTLHNLSLFKKLDLDVRVLFPARLKSAAESLKRQASGMAVEWRSMASEEELAAALNEVPGGVFAKMFICSEVELSDAQGLVQALAVLELDPSVGAVGGSLTWGGILVNAGLMAGLEDFLGSPYHNWPEDRVPASYLRDYQAVDALPALAFCIRAKLLGSECRLVGIDFNDVLNGVQFSLDLAHSGYRCILGAFSGEARRYLPALPGAGRPDGVRFRKDKSTEVAALPASPYFSKRAVAYGTLRTVREAVRQRTLENAQIPPAVLLNLDISPELSLRPTINVLLPGVKRAALTGGPNTALNVAYRLAELGFRVRIFSTDVPADADLEPIHDHILRISGGQKRLGHLEIVDAADRRKTTFIGANDIFFATAWWTARMAHAARDLVGGRPFIYLIQDYEPIFYPNSSSYALAQETYSFPHIPVINTSFLKDYLVSNAIGRFAQADHADNALFFEPAIDRQYFYPEMPKRQKRRLLFYARPTVAVRNLFEIGVGALRAAVQRGALSADAWEIVGMGEQFAPVDLGEGAMLECGPWLGFENYARKMRESDVVLSLMMSPHPSYPPLEMAGCGGLVVTNTYANKTQESLTAISGNILAAEPNVPAIAGALEEAVARLDRIDERLQAAQIALPSSWDESFSEVIPKLVDLIEAQGVPRDAANQRPPHELGFLRQPTASESNYAQFLSEARKRRDTNNVTALEDGLLSLVSTVWDTAPCYLDVLARSVREQVGGTNFEWLILDNGSTRADTRECLARIAREPHVRLERVEKNLGIIGGMRWCLEHATGRYILPLDSDDYLFEDCLRTVTWYLQRHNYPAVAYTDEDKLIGEDLKGAFLKPDFDPVLFSTQCFIAHLCAIDRKLAFSLGAYSDSVTEGSHDWDTFTRFANAGHVPVHIPEVLYSWRIHPQSTAGNIDSKPVVYSSQRGVITRWLSAQPKGEMFEIAQSPYFPQTPDWWLRRKREKGQPITTLLIGGSITDDQMRLSPGIDNRVVRLPENASLAQIEPVVASCKSAGRLVHILSGHAEPWRDDWGWEAIGIMDLHPDTVVVGGLLRMHGQILAGGGQIGFGSGFGFPDRGRSTTDPGYSAETWKHRSVGAVSSMHAVFDAAFLLDLIRYSEPRGATVQNLGAWAGGMARRTGKRVVYSPVMAAETSFDWEVVIPAAERGIVAALFEDIMPETGLISARRGLLPNTNRDAVSKPWKGSAQLADIHRPSPQDLLNIQVKAGRVADVPGADQISFSVLTTIYSGTDTELFKLTAASVLEQTHANWEWVVLTHGPVADGMNAYLEELVSDDRVKLLRLEDNLGIVGGMRFVLERATSEYILPMDSDDLLTPDALQLFAEMIAPASERPAIIYSDEDVISEDKVLGKFLRPDWDPVLDLENSWIWHAVVFRRDVALAAGVYSDRGAEYCHDWDTIDRFAANGHEPWHLPQVIYHWRHHVRSTSNAGTENTGSSRSVQHMIQRKIERAGLGGIAVVERYPIWRGATEWWAELRETDVPPPLVIEIDFDNGNGLSGEDKPIIGLGTALGDLLPEVCKGTGEFVELRTSGAFQVADPKEARKLMRFFPDLAVVSGRLVCERIVGSAGLKRGFGDRLEAPYDGLAVEAPGSMALALKPQLLEMPTICAAFIRKDFLVELLEAAPCFAVVGDLDVLLAAHARKKGKLMAFAPTFEVHVTRSNLSIDPTSKETSLSAFTAVSGQDG